jgi:predicted Rossmann fold flavoprotein
MAASRNPILIVGGGGAGLVAAWRASSLGAPVVLFERNRKPGIKLLISGGGKCNITHAGPMEELLREFLPKEARFLRPALYRWTNDDMIRLFEEAGVRTTTRENGRVFPLEGTAKNVVTVLEALLERNAVTVRLGSCVTSIEAQDARITAMTVNGQLVPSSHLILATGGASYRKTGTTGDGFRWAEKLGHTVVPIRPALAPIALRPPLSSTWRGIALRGGRLSVQTGGRTIASWDDDVLITHEGISGPAALELSRHAAVAAERGAVTVEFDFFPALEYDVLDNELTTLVQSNRGKMIGTLLEAWLPNRMVPGLLASIGADPAVRGYTLTRDTRRSITRLLKSWKMGTVASIPLDRGEVTAGGVALGEVDPHSMRSRKIGGLYLCGEVLDIAGPVGGYNLQAAFSTGYVAGDSAAQDWLRES